MAGQRARHRTQAGRSEQHPESRAQGGAGGGGRTPATHPSFSASARGESGAGGRRAAPAYLEGLARLPVEPQPKDGEGLTPFTAPSGSADPRLSLVAPGPRAFPEGSTAQGFGAGGRRACDVPARPRVSPNSRVSSPRFPRSSTGLPSFGDWTWRPVWS